VLPFECRASALRRLRLGVACSSIAPSSSSSSSSESATPSALTDCSSLVLPDAAYLAFEFDADRRAIPGDKLTTRK